MNWHTKATEIIFKNSRRNSNIHQVEIKISEIVTDMNLVKGRWVEYIHTLYALQEKPNKTEINVEVENEVLERQKSHTILKS